MVLLLSFLISGPDFGAWPDCWISSKFLRTPFHERGPASLPYGKKLMLKEKNSNTLESRVTSEIVAGC